VSDSSEILTDPVESSLGAGSSGELSDDLEGNGSLLATSSDLETAVAFELRGDVEGVEDFFNAVSVLVDEDFVEEVVGEWEVVGSGNWILFTRQ